MISSYERSDVIHIMKMSRFILSDSDSAHLTFSGTAGDEHHTVEILMAENEPQVIIRRKGKRISSETVKSIDDLKIFLEERLYKILGQDK